MRLGKNEMERRFISLDEQGQKRQHNEKYAGEIVYQVPGELLKETEPEETGGATGENGNVVQKPVSAPVAGGNEKAEITEPESREKPLQNGEDNITFRLLHWNFTKEQKAEIKRALDARLPKGYILSYAYPANSVIKMMSCRKQYESL